MTTIVPERTINQRMTALRLANDVRIGCADIKRDIRRRHLTVVGVLEAPPEYALRMRVVDLLLASPGAGPVRVSRILGRTGISRVKTVGALTERQRRELAEIWRTR